jgi:hypothetical protein
MCRLWWWSNAGDLVFGAVMSESRKRMRFRIGDIIVEYRHAHNHQVLLSQARQLNPHLTITWGNYSKNIHVHITNNLPNGEKDYQNVANIPENDFAKALELPEQKLLEFMERLVKSVKWVRPGWLARKGFQLQCQSDEWRKNIFELVTPNEKIGKGKNKKRTYLIDKISAESGLEYVELLPAASLHELRKIGYKDAIFAYSGRRKEPFLLSYTYNPSGQLRWAMLDTLKLQQLFEADFKNILLPQLEKLIPQEGWKAICELLRLTYNRA